VPGPRIPGTGIMPGWRKRASCSGWRCRGSNRGPEVILATDTVMLGHFSKDALAAAALANTLFFLAWLPAAACRWRYRR